MPSCQSVLFSFENMIQTQIPKTASAECPECGLIYAIDLVNNKKAGLRGYKCNALLGYDPETVTFTVKEGKQ